jgi:hypothetical protein
LSKNWPPPPIPTIPIEIQQAANEGNLVIFVGSGVSIQLGCPSWSGFADAALRQLAAKGLISHGEIQLLSELDSRKILSIALQVASSSSEQLDFDKLITPERQKNSKIYDHLNSIGCAYVTTNYDRFLDVPRAKPRKADPGASRDDTGAEKKDLICRPSQFSHGLLREPGSVVHLHGSLDEPKSMVITTSDYLLHYSNPQVQSFLGDLFERQTVLFLGYGLDESELLEHILRKGQRSGESRRRRYMLSGYYTHQDKTFKHLSNYYDASFGTRIVPYNLDVLGFVQLEKVVEDWSSRLVIGDPLIADDLEFVLDVANE